MDTTPEAFQTALSDLINAQDAATFPPSSDPRDIATREYIKKYPSASGLRISVDLTERGTYEVRLNANGGTFRDNSAARNLLLSVANLSDHMKQNGLSYPALRNVSFSINRNDHLTVETDKQHLGLLLELYKMGITDKSCGTPAERAESEQTRAMMKDLIRNTFSDLAGKTQPQAAATTTYVKPQATKPAAHRGINNT